MHHVNAVKTQNELDLLMNLLGKMEGSRFLCSVVDGEIRLRPVAQDVLIAAPDQALSSALAFIKNQHGKSAVVQALRTLKTQWPEAFEQLAQSGD